MLSLYTSIDDPKKSNAVVRDMDVLRVMLQDKERAMS